MKFFLLPLIILYSNIEGEAQGVIRISGNIHGLSSGNARLVYISEAREKAISSKIKEGQFSFSANLPDPERMTIFISDAQFTGEINFFAGNENISITADTSQLGKPLIQGSPTHKKYEHYLELVRPVDEKSEALNKMGTQLFLSGNLTESSKDSLFSIRDKLDSEKRALIAGFAKHNPASPISSWAISVFYGYDPDLDELIPVFRLLSPKNQQSLYGKQILEIISAAKKSAIGKMAADFKAKDLNGNLVSLYSYRGRYVLVDFWASWCGPCRAENPNIVKLYAKYHSDQFDILGVSLDTNGDAWTKAVKIDHLEWTQVSDLKAWDSGIVSGYGIKGLPFNMLLDKKGKIIAKNLRGIVLENKLKEVFD